MPSIESLCREDIAINTLSERRFFRPLIIHTIGFTRAGSAVGQVGLQKLSLRTPAGRAREGRQATHTHEYILTLVYRRYTCYHMYHKDCAYILVGSGTACSSVHTSKYAREKGKRSATWIRRMAIRYILVCTYGQVRACTTVRASLFESPSFLVCTSMYALPLSSCHDSNTSSTST